MAMNFEVTFENLRAFVVMCSILGEDAQTIHSKLSILLGDGAPRINFVYKWMREFRDGRTTLKDAPRSGRPPVLENLGERILEQLAEEPFGSIRSLAAILGCSKEAVRLTLTEELHYHKFIRKWVPHVLSAPQKQQRVSDSQELLQAIEHANGLRDTITGDESWFFSLQPRGQSMGSLCN